MKNPNPVQAASRRAGATLVELLVVTVVLALVLGLAGFATITSRGAYDQGMLAADVEVQARRALDRIAKELLSAAASSVGVDSPNPPASADVITWLDYRPVEGFAGSALTGSQRRLLLRPHAGELDDGVDNNGNGLVDECSLDLQPDALEARAVGWVGFVRRLAEGEQPNGIDDNGNGWVDEPGFFAVWEPAEAGVSGARGGRLHLQLTLERSLGAGTRVTRTVLTTVKVRTP
jgi:hypothetical protein